ncbi:MAG: CHAT domain-containing protein [Bacteroidota bacterium]
MQNKLSLILSPLLLVLLLGPLHAQRNLEMADSLIRSRQYKSAEWLINDYLQQNKSNRFAAAKGYYLLSYIALQQFQMEAATDYNRQSLELKQQLNYEFVAANYMRFGTIQLVQEDYERALEYYREAEQLPLEDLREFALLKGYMASAHAGLGQYDKAIRAYEEGLETLLTEASPSDPDVCQMRYNLGRVYFLERRYRLATRQFEEALTQLPANRELALRQRLLNARGALAQYNELKPQEAAAFYRQALAISQSTNEGHPVEKARSLGNLAELMLSEGQPDSAYYYADLGLADLSPQRPYYQLLLQLKARSAVARFEQSHEQAALEEALEVAIRAVERSETRQLRYQTIASRLRQQEERAHDIGILAAARLYELTGEDRYAEQAFLLSERSKAQVLSQMVEELDMQARFTVPEELKATGRYWSRGLRYWENARELDADSLRRYAEGYESWLRTMAQRDPAYYQLRYNRALSNIEEVRQLLQPNTALAAYYLGEKEYYIFGLSQEELQLHILPRDSIIEPFEQKQRPLRSYFRNKRKAIKAGTIGIGIYTELSKNNRALELGEAVRHYLSSIKKMRKDEFTKYSSQLYARLLRPLRRMIKRKKELIIIPHRQLYYLPFETLLFRGIDEGDKYHKMPFLIRKYAISYEHSASLLVQNERRRQQESFGEREDFLGIAPVFRDTIGAGYVWDSQNFVLDTAAQEETVMRGMDFERTYFRELKYSESEVLTIAKLFAKKKRSSKAFMHDEASERQFKEQVQNYKYVHIASHSFVNTETPSYSGIAFARAAEGSSEDGILFSAESYFLDLNADLVVLSSCESGTGRLAGEEGLLSLTRGFTYAGVPNIVASLWKVSDKHTSKLMRQFYAHLLKDESHAQALRSAKLKLAKSKKTAAPRLWSSFVLIGR